MASGRVLVVDDNADIRESIRDLLEDEGYDVRTAVHGQDGLDLLERAASWEMPDLILLDLLMPVMDGVQMLERLKGDRRFARIPVVVVSASSTVQPPPGTPILKKPLSVDQLLRAVKQHSASGAGHG